MAYTKKLKAVLGIASNDSSQDELLGYYNDQATAIILSYINNGTTFYDELPDDLDWIVDEIVVAKYNKRGDEGSASVTDGNFRVTYEDIISKYSDTLVAYRRIDPSLYARFLE